VFTGKEAVHLSHVLLDVGVTDSGDDRVTSSLLDDLWNDPATDEVVEDHCASMATEEALSNYRRHETTADRFRFFIDKEDPVGVTIKGDAKIGVVIEDGALEVTDVLRVDWTRNVVGKGAIKVKVERNDPAREVREDQRSDFAGHSIPSVNHDGEGPDHRPIDEGKDVIGETVTHVLSMNSSNVGNRAITVVDDGVFDVW